MAAPCSGVGRNAARSRPPVPPGPSADPSVGGTVSCVDSGPTAAPDEAYPVHWMRRVVSAAGSSTSVRTVSCEPWNVRSPGRPGACGWKPARSSTRMRAIGSLPATTSA
jgi:hypothetical protein